MSELDILRRKLERERAARKEAEAVTEQKTRENDYITRELGQLNDRLEAMVAQRTAELEKAHDDAIQANLIKSQFLANMSHELRTPLNAIIGYSEMLMEEAEELGEPSFAADLDKINKSGKHLLTLINDILDISKIEAGKVDMYYEPSRLTELVQDVMTTVAPLIEAGGNRLETRCVDGEIMIDVTKLRQILINLLGNAGKFTKDGRVAFEVARKTERGIPGYTFTVSDTGIGMSADEVDKLFQPFTQADSTTTRKYGGTGLGLTISRRFCEMMNGVIRVDSKPGKGSVFTCWLPAYPLGESPDGPDEDEEDADADGKVSVLLIDDEPSAQQLIGRYLAREGWTLAFAENGPEGLRLARKLRPKVICLDILMPSMDGWAVLAALKKDPALADIPVVILSMTNDKNLGFALGASEFLSKPVSREQLIEVMDKYIAPAGERSVLVIEDDATTSDMMAKLLQKEGYNVTQARNGLQALGSLAAAAPELIVLDLMMPEMDGFQFVAELREYEAWNSIPVVVVTAKTITAEDRLRLSGYVKEIIQKGSLDGGGLLSEIRRLIGDGRGAGGGA